ncbi:MAG: GAF domain-containing protein [Lyngbya sp. HA4199-MV5]|nr:GAF domain-containing protein [Lyngbya sp. HA4199-MV5]
MTDRLPSAIDHLLTASLTPEALFKALMPALGAFLGCDRCFLYLRDPKTRLGRVPFCWIRHAEIPLVYDQTWKLEPASLAEEDPMFAAALRTDPSIFVEDVETASPQVLNRGFERQSFGHRALIHAHLAFDHQLWGVLQPCLFGRPRQWTAAERQAIAQIVQTITPEAIAYVDAAMQATDPGSQMDHLHESQNLL